MYCFGSDPNSFAYFLNHHPRKDKLNFLVFKGIFHVKSTKMN